MGKRLLIAIPLVLVLGIVLALSLRGGNGKGKQVETEAVGRRSVVAKVKASGEINPRRKVEVQAKVIGEIVSLAVREGDAVRTGQVLLEIEKKLYEAARDQARAVLEQARVNLGRARAELALEELNQNRLASLLSDGVVAQDAMDRARLAHESAAVAVRSQEESIAQARSAYQRALEDLDRTTIRSPMDGVVTALNVEQGETAIVGTMGIPGSVLMVVGDLSELIAEAEVAESEVVSLALGQPAEVRLDAIPDVPLTGRVVEIGSSGMKVGDVVRFRVKVALDAPDPRVRPGMTAKVEITTATAEQALAVPQQAVVTRWLDGQGEEVERREGDAAQREVRAVYLRSGDKAERHEVTTGIQDALWVEIKDGIAEGDSVIVGPYRVLRGLKVGDAVRPAPAAAGEDEEKRGADRDS